MFWIGLEFWGFVVGFFFFFSDVELVLVLVFILSYLYILEINPLSVASFANIFLPFCRLSFCFVYGLLCCAKAFKFN